MIATAVAAAVEEALRRAQTHGVVGWAHKRRCSDGDADGIHLMLIKFIVNEIPIL